ncbi:hypothetical protein FNF27_02493 [Cafeteria roenbergensis]|uniref:Band 7 domain-containing protein n=1 Tax=Cafeteria roenbergensis TaxID=33653 RepID=A0A5A8DPP7_CAFRO|nr:hypothetical protein FNF29_04381 [Cafeteria roenbergensis]KAA0167413.1 hypothetical protein FNF31_00854 [Cafeteria roenbergensis]KAA0172332.1 hypothetical protein FNF28_00016 [Cafeteria roenbergensis]KAA0176103.1 hypothetical protein FNF27_02493 [Cafeteria roenbergensis]|eukprot:KAA0151695.1 hypothetical protein FNF29_04381 [Cafeteria roenbergensis]
MGRGTGRGSGRGGELETPVMIGGCCCVVVTILTVALVGCSFSTLEWTQAGVGYNTFDRSIDSTRVYLGGRYFLGLARSFYVFPTTYQTIEFSRNADADSAALVAQTPDGAVTFDVSLQYQLDLTKLVEVYRAFELNYHDRFVRIAQAALQNAAVSVSDVSLFYTSRVQIQNDLLLPAVRAALGEQHALVQDLQLRRVTLPSKTEQEVVAKLVRKQEEVTAIKRQQQATIASRTDVLVADVRKDIELYQSNRTAEARILLETATAEAVALTLDQQSVSFNSLRNGVGLSGADVVRLRFLDEISLASSQTTLLIGFDDETIAKVAA